MHVRRLLAVVALTMTTLAATCPDQEARDQIAALKAQLDTVSKDFNQYRAWLGKSASPTVPDTMTVDKWHDNVRIAICSLEDKVKPPVNKRLCHPQGAHGNAPHPPPFL